MQITNKNTLRSLATLATFIITLSQSSCSNNIVSSQIIIARAGKINSIDPAQASTFPSLQVISALGDTLYILDKDGSLKPQLAKSLPRISDHGLTISIPLKRNILFHDGTEFNSYAMKFTLNRFIKIGTLNYILDGKIKSIETPDPYLIKLRLTKPYSSIAKLLTTKNLTPISPNSYLKYKDNFLNDKFIGTGPYKLESFSPYRQRLKAFGKYWNGDIKNKGVDLITLNNSTSLFAAMISGEIDVLLSSSLEEDHKIYLSKEANKGVLREGKGNALEIGYITLRANNSPLKEKQIREALNYSLDRELISKRVSYGLRKPLRNLVPPNLWEGRDNKWPSYNPNKSRELLTKAGYCLNKKLVLPLTFRSNIPADKLLALTWQEQTKRDLSDCIKIELNGLESTTIYRQLGKGSFDAVILDWRGSYPDPEAYLTPFLSCKKIKDNVCEEGEASISGSFWSSSQIEKLLKESNKRQDKSRAIILNKVEQKAAEGAAYIPVWLITPRAWSKFRINGLEFNGNGQLLLKNLEKIK